MGSVETPFAESEAKRVAQFALERTPEVNAYTESDSRAIHWLADLDTGDDYLLEISTEPTESGGSVLHADPQIADPQRNMTEDTTTFVQEAEALLAAHDTVDEMESAFEESAAGYYKQQPALSGTSGGESTGKTTSGIKIISLSILGTVIGIILFLLLVAVLVLGAAN